MPSNQGAPAGKVWTRNGTIHTTIPLSAYLSVDWLYPLRNFPTTPGLFFPTTTPNSNPFLRSLLLEERWRNLRTLAARQLCRGFLEPQPVCFLTSHFANVNVHRSLFAPACRCFLFDGAGPLQPLTPGQLQRALSLFGLLHLFSRSSPGGLLLYDAFPLADGVLLRRTVRGTGGSKTGKRGRLEVVFQFKLPQYAEGPVCLRCVVFGVGRLRQQSTNAPTCNSAN